jgi:oxygen-independent coproporphyrinogen III oxidase
VLDSGLPWGRLFGVRPTKQLHRLLDEGLGYQAAWLRLHEAHGISREKFELLWRVAQAERPILAESARPDLFSVYVGIPFCPTRCLYCSFPSHSLNELGRLRSRFVETLLREIAATGRLARKLQWHPYSFYVGGGTPTSLTPADLGRILAALRESFPGTLREFTVEAGRPDTITLDHLQVCKTHGVTRVSVNPQTMHAVTMQTIGRCHSPADVADAIHVVRKVGFPVINMDLIVGLPGENTAMITESVTQTMAFAPENITLHMFSRKRASRFSEEQDLFSLPDSDAIQNMYHAAVGLLEKTYDPYYLYRQRGILGGHENIGYCLPGSECVYNIAMIEERHHIFGLGGGATSKIIRSDLSLTNILTPKDVRHYLERADLLCRQREATLIRN